MAASASAAFVAIGKAMQADATLASKVGGVLQFELGSVSWTVDCTGEGSVAEGRASAPDATITMSEPDFLKLYAGTLNGTTAYMSGKMKADAPRASRRHALPSHRRAAPPQIKGNIGLAQKLAGLTAAARKRGAAAAATPSGGGAPAAAGAGAAAGAAGRAGDAIVGTPPGFESDAVFARMAANLRTQPRLPAKVEGSFGFTVTGGPGGAVAEWWVVARSDAAPRVAVGKPATKPDCLVTISDAHLVALAAGKLNGSALPEHAKSPPRAPPAATPRPPEATSRTALTLAWPTNSVPFLAG